jgi:flagellar basal body-associated protein FliL
VTRRKALCPLLIAALLLVCTGCRKSGGPREAVWSAGEFLTDAGNGVFVKLEVAVVVSSEEAAQELDKIKPAVRDEVLRATRNAGARLLGPGGTEELGKDLKERLNGMLKRGRVLSVLFPQLVFEVVK